MTDNLLDVRKTHRIDASECDSNGMYEFYYEYDWFEFIFDDGKVVGRSYVDTPDEASILGADESWREELQQSRKRIVADEFKRLGFKKIKMLTKDGYVDYPFY